MGLIKFGMREWNGSSLAEEKEVDMKQVIVRIRKKHLEYSILVFE